MPTVLNKAVVGRLDGNVEAYNASTGRLVHTILTPSSGSGSVTAMSQHQLYVPLRLPTQMDRF
jgi:U3 small nucleolar RNA-associated protein 21